VRITAHLTGIDSDSEIRVFATPHGGTRTLLASGSPDANGDVAVTARPKRNTVYQAEVAATTEHVSATSRRRTVLVRVITTASLSGYYAAKAGYHLYRYTPACPRRHRACPTVTVGVRPNHAGQPVNIRLQIKTRSGWAAVLGHEYRLNTRSRIRIVVIYRNSTIIGHRFRISGYFGGDADHAAAPSPWRYFRVTG
jgi:hypothetical protein